VVYDSKYYTANLFRHGKDVFFRSLFLFDERVEDRYLTEPCVTFDAVYENLPMVDTIFCPAEEESALGLFLQTEGAPMTAKKTDEGVLRIDLGPDSVIFREDHLEIRAAALLLHRGAVTAKLSVDAEGLLFRYRDVPYRLRIEGGRWEERENGDVAIFRDGSAIILYPQKSDKNLG
jgi:hypothetical protein